MQHLKLSLISFFILCFAPLMQAQNGLNFDGIDDYIQTSYAGIAGNADRTIEAWVKTTKNSLPAGQGGQGQSVIVDWGTIGTSSRFTFCILFNNALRLEVQGNGLSGTIPVNDGNWHHVAVTYNSSATNTYSLYVDGVLDIAGNLTVATNTGTAVQMKIGERIDAVNRFEGSMDELRVWNYARTQAQIQADMNVEYCSVPAGLVAYHKFNQGVAGQPNTTVTASMDAAQGNNGTLQNFTLNGTTSNWVLGQTLTTSAVSASQTLVECDGYTVTVGTNTYSTTGVYIDTLVGAAVGGCDSIVTTDLTINTPPAAFSQTLVECAGYSVMVGSMVHSTTGVYNDTLWGMAANGCDSVVMTDLTITPSATFSQTLVECAGYSVMVGSMVHSTTGVYNDTLWGMAANGCDSIVMTDLTITPSATFSQTLVECAGYSVMVGSTVHSTTGVYNDTLWGMAANGCDSIVTTDLTVDAPVDVSTSTTGFTISAAAATATYQWLDCNNGNNPIAGETNQSFMATANGDYAVVVTVGNCSDTSACVNITGVGISEIESAAALTLYPNPTTGLAYIRQGASTELVQIEVMDLTGKIILEMESYDQNIALDLSAMASGVYFVRLRNQDQIIKVLKK